MIKFRQKQFNLMSDVWNGGSLGAGIGTIAATVYNAAKKGNNKFLTAAAIIGGGTVIGAGLGLLTNLVKRDDLDRSRLNVDDRMMKHVVIDLKKEGFIEGKDFTRDPKKANELKSKVCIVMSKNSGDLNLLVNVVQDYKLKEVSEEMVKNLPNSSIVNSKMSDKFNDISISKISDSSADAGLIASIASRFIRKHYPVYLVEVG